jgi:hypothetical protein
LWRLSKQKFKLESRSSISIYQQLVIAVMGSGEYMQYYWHHIPELEEGEIMRDSWWLRMLVWTKWTNCPASPAAIVVIQEL